MSNTVWLKPNQRLLSFGAGLATLIALLGFAIGILSWRSAPPADPQSFAEGAGFFWLAVGWTGRIIMLFGIAVVAGIVYQMLRPRIGYHGGLVSFYLRHGKPIVVPVEVVEAFFLGQGPHMETISLASAFHSTRTDATNQSTAAPSPTAAPRGCGGSIQQSVTEQQEPQQREIDADASSQVAPQGNSVAPQANSTQTCDGGLQSIHLIARIAERATEWHYVDLNPSFGKWEEGYVTIHGNWTEPLDIDLVRRLNRQLTAARSSQPQTKKSPSHAPQSTPQSTPQSNNLTSSDPHVDPISPQTSHPSPRSTS